MWESSVSGNPRIVLENSGDREWSKLEQSTCTSSSLGVVYVHFYTHTNKIAPFEYSRILPCISPKIDLSLPPPREYYIPTEDMQ
jgi:hypothetical protein